MSDDDHDPTAERNRISRATLFLWIPVIYVLSVGPAGRLYLQIQTDFPRAAHAMQVFYIPLSWISKQSPRFEGFFDWYFDLWLRF